MRSFVHFALLVMFVFSAAAMAIAQSPGDKLNQFQAEIEAAKSTAEPVAAVNGLDLLPAAEAGDPSAMMAVGNAYDKGLGIEKDPGAAYKWYSLAARAFRARGDTGGVVNAVKSRTATAVNMDTQTRNKSDIDVENWVAASPVADAEFKDMIQAKSTIVAATVYNNRAKVTRVAEVDVPAGAQTIVFKDLPALLLPDSLRAEGTAKAEVKFGAVAHKVVMESDFASPREKELSDRLQALNDRRRVIEAEGEAIGAQKRFLENMASQASLQGDDNKFAESHLKPEQWAAVAQTIRESMAAVLEAKRQQELKLRELDRDINQVNATLGQLRTGQRSIFAVTVPVEAAAATKLKIELSYQVPNATWKPIYDARLASEGESSLQLVQYGSVRQQTGEDWTGIALTLSTAQPQRGASLPELQPVWVDAILVDDDAMYARTVQQQNLERAMQAAESGGSSVPTPIGAAENQTLTPSADPLAEWRAKTEARRIKMDGEILPDVDARFVPAVINTGGFMSEYKIPGPANVLSDGTETKLMIGAVDLDSKLQVHIKPQMSKDAFLVAKTKLNGEAPILPGQVNLFRDGAYVGQSALPLLRPDEDYDLYFGIDDKVAVSRKVLKDERQEEGLISRDSLLERDFVTELQNLHSAPVEIVVKETVPASRNEKVTIEIDKNATTPGFKADAENIKGLLAWEFKMEPKAKKDLKLGWTVKWPKDHTLTGL